MFVKTVASMGIRHWVLLGALSFIVSFCGVFGFSYGAGGDTGNAVIPLPLCVVLTFVFAFVVAFVILACNAGLTKLTYDALNAKVAHGAHDDSVDEESPSKLWRFVPQKSWRSIILFALIMMLFWSPYLVAAFPGILNSDTANQMQQVYEEMHPLDLKSGGLDYLPDEYVDRIQQSDTAPSDAYAGMFDFVMTDAWLIDHNPFTLTLLFGSLAHLSDDLFGSWTPALGLLAWLQVIIAALELAFCVALLRSKGAPPWICFAAMVFFCLVPMVPIYAYTPMKDSFFGLLFIPYLIVLAESVSSKGVCFQRKRTVARLVLVALALCLVKKSGVYVVGATALFGCILWAVRYGRAKGAQRSTGTQGEKEAKACRAAGASALAYGVQGAVCALVMFALLPAVVFPALNIVPGGRQEVFGTLFQQTGKVIAEHGVNALTSEEKVAVGGVLRLKDIDVVYDPTIADPVKRRHDLLATDEQMADYVRAYVSMGLRYPVDYLAASVSLSAGFLSPVDVSGTEKLPDAASFEWKLLFDDGRVPVSNLDATAPLREGIATFLEAWYHVPGLGLVLKGVTYDLWIPVLLLFFCLRNRLGAGVMFVACFMVTVFCLLSFTYDLRHLFSLILAAPLLLGFAVIQAQNVFKERAERANAQAGGDIEALA